MIFANTRMLWMSAALLPLAAWFLWWSWRRKEQLMRLFISDRLRAGLLDAYSPRRQRTKALLWLAGLLFLLLALARPQWGFIWEETTQRGRDIIVAIDTSRSMLAQDMAPDRLTRAKLAALDLLRLAKNDRLGLIAFAGGAFLQCPLTMDDEVFRQNVNALDIGIIPQGGTAIGEAIDVALDAFASEEGDNHRVMVLFTDGEDHESGVMEEAARAKDRNLKIFTVGVGTPAGHVLRVVDEQGRASFVKDNAGNVVQSKLNEDLLRQIATEANGFYLPLRDANAMQVLFQRGIEPLQAGELSSKMMRRLNERFYWPLSIAVLLLLIEALLPPTPRRRAVAVAAAMLMFILPAQASPQRAYRDFKEGRFKEAHQEYQRLLEKNPLDPKLNYNAGAAAYQAGEFDTAVKSFNQAATAQDLELQESAYYNLGNANYRLGEHADDAKAREALWQQALKNYDAALKLNPADKDAAFNQQVVKQRLEQLRQQQQQQQKKDKNNDNKDQQNQNQDGEQKQQENKDQNQENQQQEQQQQQDNQQQKEEEEKQKSENQQAQDQQQQKQQQQGENKEESQNQGDGQESERNEEQDRERAQQEAKAAALGQMTETQAERVLDAQKTEERAMIFKQSRDKAKGPRSIKDW